MILLPIPGAPGYRVDCENQEVYSIGNTIRRLKHKSAYKSLSISVDGKQIGTTVYRLMYCAQHSIDVTKIPPGTCIAMRNGMATVVSRSDIQGKRIATLRTRRKNLDDWKRNVGIIAKYYDGDTKPLLNKLHGIEKMAKEYFINTYHLSNERAELIAAYGIDKYMNRVNEGTPSPFILSSVIRYGHSERRRQKRQYTYYDNMQPIEL